MMTRQFNATARQLDFTDDGPGLPAGRPVAKPGPGPARLCVVCGRVRAHLTLEREPGHRPARLCLRCHHAVMQQRRMARAGLGRGDARRVTARVELIVPRESDLPRREKYRRLSRARRRAQQAARESGKESERRIAGDPADNTPRSQW